MVHVIYPSALPSKTAVHAAYTARRARVAFWCFLVGLHHHQQSVVCHFMLGCEDSAPACAPVTVARHHQPILRKSISLRETG